MRRRPPLRQRPMLEELEPRILFSADAAAGLLDPSHFDAQAQVRMIDVVPPAPTCSAVYADVSSVPLAFEHNQGQTGAQVDFRTTAAGEYTSMASTLRNELVIVDTRVDDYQTLLDDILNQAGDERHFDVVLLDANRDGIEQITEALQQRGNLDALHLITHGESGSLQLGSGRLDAASLDARAVDIAAWGLSFNADADLLLYGCDVAAGTAGERFVTALAYLTGTDVAASTDRTGSATLGGDWLLEFSTGRIETTLAIDTAGQSAWAGALGNEFQVNQASPNEQDTSALNRGSQQAVAYDGAGNFVVAWESRLQDGSGLGVYARRFAADGSALTSEILVNATTANDQMYARVASDNAGNFVVTWTSNGQDGSGLGVYVRRFAADGTALTGEIRANATTAGDQQDSVIGMNRATGDFVVAWQGAGPGDGAGIFFRRFGADGAALDAADQRANLTDAGTEQNAAVAMDSSGRFVIAFDVNNHMYFQRFDQAGTAQGGRVQVDNVLSTSTGAAIAMDGSGNFTLVYREQNILTGVWGRGYYADGTDRYLWFQAATGDATSPSIAMDTTGAFVVTYQKTGADRQDIYARKFNANGSPNGSAFAVNQYTNNDQKAPSVAVRDMDNFVVVWSGQSASDSRGVSARVFSSPNTAPVITSDGSGASASINVAENATAVTTVTATDADLPAQTLTYSISGGADAAKFTIGSTTGVLSFITAPNYEAPTDSGANNVYDVTVQVSDGFLTDTQGISVTVTDVNEAPVAQNDIYTTARDTVLTIPAATGLLVNDSDPENDTLSVLSAGTPSHGSLSPIPGDGSFAYTPDTGYVGSDSFTYTISDGNGHTSGATVAINITFVNVAPTTTLVTLSAIAEDSGPRLITQAELLANAGDANGDSLVATGLAISGGAGSLADNGNGTWSYTPALNDHTPVNFTYAVSDGSLTAAGSATLDITPVNDAPVAASATINATEDTLYSGNLPAASDVESDPISYALNVQAAQGTVAVNSDGSFTYAPDANFNGVDSFSYTVSDGNGGSNSYSVTVNVAPVNDAPVANDDAFSVNEDSVLTGDVLANDTDAEAASLTATLVTGPSHGSLILNTDGSFTYTPNGDWNGADTFTYNAYDGSANSNVASVTLTVDPVNDAPTGSVTIDNATPAQGDTLTASNTLADADGLGAITYAWKADGSTVGAGSAYVVTEAEVGKLITVVASYTDGHGTAELVSSAATAAVTNVNDAPTGSVTIDNATPAQGDTLTASNTLADADGLGAITYAWKADGSTVGAGSTYVVTEAEVGKLITVVASYTDGHGTAELVSSAATAAVTNVNKPVTTSGSTSESAAESEVPTANGTPTIDGADSVVAAPPPTPKSPPNDKAPEEPAQQGNAMNDAGADEITAVSTTEVERSGGPNAGAPLLVADSQDARQRADAGAAHVVVLPEWMLAQFPQFAELGGEPAADFRSLAAISRFGSGTSAKAEALARDLDALREDVKGGASIEHYTLNSAVAVSTGLSVGYAAWLVRGGVLLSTLLSSMPAWRVLDPFPVLARQRDPDEDDDDDGDDDSLESMVGDDGGDDAPGGSDEPVAHRADSDDSGGGPAPRS